MDARRLLEGLPGYSHVEATMTYTHVLRELKAPAASPLDRALADAAATARDPQGGVRHAA